MTGIIFAYLHVIAFMTLFSALFVEHMLYKPSLSVPQARSLMIVDRIYGVSAVVVLITGLARFAFFEKGAVYYMNSGVFLVKVLLFITAAALSIYPTIQFLGWRSAVSQDMAPEVDAASGRWVLQLIRVQLALILIIPLLAVVMARG